MSEVLSTPGSPWQRAYIERVIGTIRRECLDHVIVLSERSPRYYLSRCAPLTRFGVRYILAKYCALARETMPTLAMKRLHPHSMRHSTAVHLLRSGVDIVTISQWLGHASVTTTNRYATVDLEMKRKALELARPIDHVTTGIALWRTDASILTWLESL